MNKFEEYKLFVEETTQFSSRRQTVNNLYVTVNSIIMTGTAFLAREVVQEGLWKVSPVLLLLAVVGAVICLQWQQLLEKHKTLVGFRIKQLREMEEHPDMAGCHQMYHREDELYPVDDDGRPIAGKGLNLSDREKWLPRVFMLVYLSGVVGVAAFGLARLLP